MKCDEQLWVAKRSLWVMQNFRIYALVGRRSRYRSLNIMTPDYLKSRWICEFKRVVAL